MHQKVRKQNTEKLKTQETHREQRKVKNTLQTCKIKSYNTSSDMIYNYLQVTP